MTREPRSGAGGPAPQALSAAPGPGVARTLQALFAVLLLWLQAASVGAEPLPTRELAIADRTLVVEIADTPETMSRGLMFREYLPEDHGMLFIWPAEQVVGMWMKNTRIPLSVAFIDRDLRIRNIADMEPHSRRVHASQGPVRFALEVNRGWFDHNGITAGMRLDGLEALLASLLEQSD